MRAWLLTMPATWDLYDYKAVRMPLEEVRARFEGGPANEQEEGKL